MDIKRRFVVFVLQVAIVSLCVLLAPAVSTSQEIEQDSVVIDGTPHWPAEIFKIMERSQVRYLIHAYDDTTRPVDSSAPPVFYDQYYVVFVDGLPHLTPYTTVDSIHEILDASSEAFSGEDYTTSLELYRESYFADTTFHPALIYIGDSFYMLGHYDSAMYYFSRFIEHDYIYYQPHWFLGDALWNTGDTSGAIRELTMAHVLNRNHETLRGRLEQVRQLAGRPLADWTPEPEVYIYKDSEAVHIYAGSDWIAYALVKAIWEYEPGYTEAMVENSKGNLLARPLLEGREAFLALANSQSEYIPRLEKAMDGGYLDHMILYVITAPADPRIMLFLDRETLGAVADYVDKYH